MKKRKLVLGAAVVALLVGWYLFRPELLFIDAKVMEDLPQANADASSSTIVKQGSFHAVAHTGKGMAAIHRLADGRRVLRFTNFETSNGPALHVYLVKADDATDSAAVSTAGFVDLGALKGNLGDQNYAIPDDVDLSMYGAATIWCQRFSVNFATAPLR